jgi:hypothetical protein
MCERRRVVRTVQVARGHAVFGIEHDVRHVGMGIEKGEYFFQDAVRKFAQAAWTTGEQMPVQTG